MDTFDGIRILSFLSVHDYDMAADLVCEVFTWSASPRGYTFWVDVSTMMDDAIKTGKMLTQEECDTIVSAIKEEMGDL